MIWFRFQCKLLGGGNGNDSLLLFSRGERKCESTGLPVVPEVQGAIPCFRTILFRPFPSMVTLLVFAKIAKMAVKTI